jgi:hypothetical protein
MTVVLSTRGTLMAAWCYANRDVPIIRPTRGNSNDPKKLWLDRVSTWRHTKCARLSTRTISVFEARPTGPAVTIHAGGLTGPTAVSSPIDRAGSIDRVDGASIRVSETALCVLQELKENHAVFPGRSPSLGCDGRDGICCSGHGT